MKAPQLKVGDRVRMIMVPPQVEQDQSRFPETFAIFHKAVGRTYRVRGYDEYGQVELWLLDDGSEDNRGVKHSVWVEPDFMSAV